MEDTLVNRWFHDMLRIPVSNNHWITDCLEDTLVAYFSFAGSAARRMFWPHLLSWQKFDESKLPDENRGSPLEMLRLPPDTATNSTHPMGYLQHSKWKWLSFPQKETHCYHKIAYTKLALCLAISQAAPVVLYLDHVTCPDFLSAGGAPESSCPEIKPTRFTTNALLASSTSIAWAPWAL